MGRIPRILIVYKKGAYQQHLSEQPDSRLVRLLRKKDPDVMRMQQAHFVHEASLESVLHKLRELPVEFDVVSRTDLNTKKSYDLIISIGGDGTFLQAAHTIEQTPILGVNSDPLRSEAVFCAATARTFLKVMRKVLSGKLSCVNLFRLQVVLNARALKPLAVNDVLLAHDDPATLSRYRLRIGSREEFHKSSGLWVATAAGSSSAISAAGGICLPWRSRRFQYRPRELYLGRLSRCRLTGGVLSPGVCLRMRWLMRHGSIFMDGAHERFALKFGDRVEVRVAAARKSLRVLGLGPSRQ